MLQHETKTEAFTGFVEAHEASLRGALTAALGVEVGREAAAEALAYGWANWDRVSAMDNPAGYLYRMGRNLGRRMHRSRRVLLPEPEAVGEPLVEPGLPAALAGLSERQRVVIWLVHSADWSMGEVADFLGISKASVQTHAERGMAKLRRRMGAAR